MVVTLVSAVVCCTGAAIVAFLAGSCWSLFTDRLPSDKKDRADEAVALSKRTVGGLQLEIAQLREELAVVNGRVSAINEIDDENAEIDDENAEIDAFNDEADRQHAELAEMLKTLDALLQRAACVLSLSRSRLLIAHFMTPVTASKWWRAAAKSECVTRELNKLRIAVGQKQERASAIPPFASTPIGTDTIIGDFVAIFPPFASTPIGTDTISNSEAL